MDENEYLEVAKGNEEVAKWAKKNNYYNASVSRYYYALYQKLLCVISKKGIKFGVSRSTSSHKDTINSVVKHYRSRGEIAVVTQVNYLHTLRKKRNDADYKKKFNEKEMNNFLVKYHNINIVLNNIIR